MLAVYAELDARVNATRATAEKALKDAGLEHKILSFEGADHAFFNDTGQRYNARAATEAYQELLDWFGTHLAWRPSSKAPLSGASPFSQGALL